MTDFFADTYAILALLAGDEEYAARFRRGSFRTGTLNVAEAAYAQLVQEVAADEARGNLAPFHEAAEAPTLQTLLEAARQRAEMVRKRRPWSFADAVGYVQARTLELPLLTGDAVFEGVPGVEFLKEHPEGRRK